MTRGQIPENTFKSRNHLVNRCLFLALDVLFLKLRLFRKRAPCLAGVIIYTGIAIYTPMTLQHTLPGKWNRLCMIYEVRRLKFDKLSMRLEVLDHSEPSSLRQVTEDTEFPKEPNTWARVWIRWEAA